MEPTEISKEELASQTEKYIAEVKQFRKEIDVNINKAEQMLTSYPTELQHISCGREISLVRTKLQEAKMWAGKILEVLGSPFPKELADKAE